MMAHMQWMVGGGQWHFLNAWRRSPSMALCSACTSRALTYVPRNPHKNILRCEEVGQCGRGPTPTGPTSGLFLWILSATFSGLSGICVSKSRATCLCSMTSMTQGRRQRGTGGRCADQVGDQKTVEFGTSRVDSEPGFRAADPVPALNPAAGQMQRGSRQLPK